MPMTMAPAGILYEPFAGGDSGRRRNGRSRDWCEEGGRCDDCRTQRQFHEHFFYPFCLVEVFSPALLLTRQALNSVATARSSAIHRPVASIPHRIISIS
jgi:hypothetical protein